MNYRMLFDRKKRDLLFLFLLMLAAYIAGLFVDVTRDGSKYAAIAREIYETGDFAYLKVHGEPYLQKPPMLFWISALSFYLFGLSNFAFKLPLLMFSFFGLYSVYRLGEIMYNRKVGFISMLLLGSSQIYFLYNMDIHTDTLLQVFVTFALYQLYGFLTTGRNINLFLGFLGIGLALLTKGPVGAVVPVFAVCGYLISSGKFSRMADYRWFLGILFTIVIILPYLATLYNQFGWEGIRFYFWTNNFGRIRGNYSSAGRDYFFYIYNLVYLFAPWMLLLFVSAFYDVRLLLKRKFNPRDWFVFSGICFYFLIISVSKGKLPNYLFILMPLFSVVTAKYIFIALYGHRRRMMKFLRILQNIVPVVIGLLLVALVSWFYPVKHLWQLLLLLISGWVAMKPFLYNYSPVFKLLVPSLAMIVTLNFFINQHVAPQIFSDQASVKAAKIFNREAKDHDKLSNYNYFSHELFFYGKSPVRQVLSDLELFELMKQPGNWVFTTEEVVNRMPQDEFPKPVMIPLKHVWINKLKFQYLNPRTRQKSYEPFYLLHSQAAGE